MIPVFVLTLVHLTNITTQRLQEGVHLVDQAAIKMKTETVRHVTALFLAATLAGTMRMKSMCTATHVMPMLV